MMTKKTSNLTPQVITDKNGKTTTVYVSADKPSNSTSRRSTSLTTPPKMSQHYEPEVVIKNPATQAHANQIVNPETGSLEWDGVYLDHENYTSGAFTFDLAPPGYSGAFCQHCGSFFTDDEVDAAVGYRAHCSVCGDTTMTMRVESAVRDTDLKFFDKNVVRETKWYHLTTRPDWSNDIHEYSADGEKPLVHIGSLEAAEKRMKDLIVSSKKKPVHERLPRQELSPADFYCYEIVIKPAAAIADDVINDDDDLAPTTANEVVRNQSLWSRDGGHTTDDYEVFGVTRYVNEFESQGSVSLLAHPVSFDVTKRFQWS
jgi:hypothetical protein